MEAEFDYFEDLHVGRVYQSTEKFEVTREEVISYAERWDWRLYHVDEAAAQHSVFRGLVACGSQIIGIWTRLSLIAQESELRLQAMLAGLGCEFRLLQPVRPGDVLRYRGTIVNMRASESRQDSGVVETQHQLFNQDDVLVFESKATTLVRTRTRT